ncbi:hypothetical protein N431DRAFT_486544 [Stipitochalara longipes BDJ]|nr:hypothetical protein N431DRAFT_486544 [Stipitochalara longipes BDJ]
MTELNGKPDPTHAASESAAAISRTFYDPRDPKLGEPLQEILRSYSGIADYNEQITHVKAVRDKAWQVFKYPCVGLYAFVDLHIHEMNGYNDIVKRIQSGQKFLDIGCCLGQEIRKLVQDGAPSENIMGSELHGEFVELGYDLFRDHEKLKSRFVVGDFFKLTRQDFHGERFDIIYQSAWLHLFNLQDQTDLVIKIVTELLKGPGSMFVGRQIGAMDATEYQSKALRSGACYWHNEETWQRMVNDVASKIGKKFESKFELREKFPRSNYDFGRDDLVNFEFCITLL